MTCEEFRETVSRSRPEQVTRAVRAAMIFHGRTCRHCYRWVSLPSEGGDTNSVSLSGLEMLAEDLQDPEFRVVVEGE